MNGKKIEQGIYDLTRANSTHAPAFNALLERKRTPRTGWWVAAAAVLLPFAAVLVVHQVGERQDNAMKNARTLVAWRAPTDVFLRSPWSAAVPPLGTFDLSFYDGTQEATADREVTP